MKLSCIGIIGDVHAESQRLEAALDFLQRAAVERIVCIGDIVDGHGDAERCCQLLEQAGVAVVRGNHDRWCMDGQMRDLPQATRAESLIKRSRLFLQSLPATQSFETVAGQMLLCHGLGANDMQRLTPDDYGYALEVNEELQHLIGKNEFRFVVGGHTHHRMVRHFGPLTIINAGTLYDGHEPCMVIAHFDSLKIQFHNFVGESIEAAGKTISLSGA